MASTASGFIFISGEDESGISNTSLGCLVPVLVPVCTEIWCESVRFDASRTNPVIFT
jgi:hypothetical protein